MIVVSAIYLEKYLLTILGALTFKWLIPVSMLALAVYFGSKKELFWKIGVKYSFWTGNICGYSGKCACLKNDLQYIPGVN